VQVVGNTAALSLFEASGRGSAEAGRSTALSLLEESGLAWDRRVAGRAKCRNFVGLAVPKHSEVRREDRFGMEVRRIEKGLNSARKGLLKGRRARGSSSADVRNRVTLLVVEEGVSNSYFQGEAATFAS
jgi:hypothetical protein